MHKVFLKKSVIKSLKKMPVREKTLFKTLVEDIRADGPEQSSWPNYSKLSEIRYHCHLSRKWVVCWRQENGNEDIEVYYAGSRENAPY